MIGFILRYRYIGLALSTVALIGGSWVNGYIKGKAHERASIAQEQIVLMSAAQKDRERIDEQTNKITDIDAALFDNGWLRTRN